MRRQEFEEKEASIVAQVFTQARYGHMAILDGETPRALPLNFVRTEDNLWFHGSPRGFLTSQVDQTVSFTAQDMMTWIPSTWRHPHMACPATTYYRSASLSGRLELEQSLVVRARVLEAFMEKYQPEGGYRGIRADDPKYVGPLEGLSVVKLPLGKAVGKVKMGQHLTPTKRRAVHRGLVNRGGPGDRWCALEMERVDPQLRTYAPARIHWVEDPRSIPLDQLCALLNSTYWAAERPAHLVAQHLDQSLLTLAALEDGRLVAYARLTSTGRGTAHLFDVVVAAADRGRRLGSELMGRLLHHPGLANIERILLDTRDAMPFYRRFGFQDLMRSDRNGGSTLMIGGAGVGRRLPMI